MLLWDWDIPTKDRYIPMVSSQPAPNTHSHLSRGAETIFFGGGGNVDMPSDCQNLGGGHRHIHPLETISCLGGGAIIE